MEVLERIQAWHKAQLERGRDPALGVRIETLRERPGWSVQIDLSGTPLSGLKLAPYREGATDRDWLAYRIKDVPDIEVIGSARHGLEAVELIQKLRRTAERIGDCQAGCRTNAQPHSRERSDGRFESLQRVVDNFRRRVIAAREVEFALLQRPTQEFGNVEIV